MLEKIEGCDYCNNMEYMKLYEGEKPNYCKMCGRKLVGE